MREDRSIIQDMGRRAIRLAFGIKEAPGASTMASIVEEKNQPGGGGSWKSAATRVHATESIKTSSSRPVLPGNQRLTGYIHRCISELNVMEKQWVRFRYMPACNNQRDAGAKFVRSYSALYDAAHLQGARAGTRAIVREMVAFRMAQCLGIIPELARFESQNGAMTRQAWSKTYDKHWKIICKDVHLVDGAAVYKVGVKLCLEERI